MKFWEAMKALEEGKKVRCICWEKNKFLSVGLYSSDGNNWPLTRGEAIEEWELYEEPVQLLSFSEMVKGLKECKKYKRKSAETWPKNLFLSLSSFTDAYGRKKINKVSELTVEDFEATDWMEVK